jgi:histidine ammonia-lyase
MIAQVTAAALTSELKTLAHPASVDTIPTSANQEDHVSMATFSAARLHTMLDNVAHIVAIELLAAVQGVEFHRPTKTSVVLENVMEEIRAVSTRYVEDRPLSGDITRLAQLMNDGFFYRFAASVLPSTPI